MEEGNILQIEAELVEVILKEHFGSRCAEIGMILLSRGALPLMAIGHACGYPFLELRNCLMVLIQQNAVSYETHAEAVIYTLNAKEILFRLRFSHYALYIQRHKGSLCRILFTEILKSGRISLKYLIQRVLEDHGKLKDKMIQIWHQGYEDCHEKNVLNEYRSDTDDLLSLETKKDVSLIFKEDTLKASFLKLVEENYVMRVDHVALKSDVSSVHITAPTTAQSRCTKKKRETKTVRRKKLKPDPAPDVTLQYSDKSVLTSEQFLNIKSSKNDNELDPIHLNILESSKTTFNASMILQEFEKSGVAFRANVRHLNFVLLCEEAEEFMAVRWGDSRIIRYITRILLQSSRQEASGEVKAEGKTFVEITSALEKLSTEVVTSFRVPDSHILLQLFDALDRTDRIIHHITSDDGVSMFIFNWTRFKNCIHDRAFFNAVAARHGVKSGRVWNLLRLSSTEVTDTSTPKLWEDQQVADQALLPPHTAREILYRLASGGLIRMHQSDLVTGAPSTSSSKHGLLFYASLSLAKAQILQDTYKALLNLWQRKQHEALKITQLMCSNVKDSVVEESQLRYRETLEDRLECSFLQLDATALLYLRDMV